MAETCIRPRTTGEMMRRIHTPARTSTPVSGIVVVVSLCVGACAGATPGVSGESGGVVVSGELGREVDSFLRQAADSGFNGTVLVATDGRIVLHKGYGWADQAHTERVTTRTPFWIASISKQFAAVATLKLVEQGRLAVDDPISRFFPSLAPEKQNITIHQLLTHTAGLEQRYAADGVTDRDQAVRAILDPPLVAAPGDSFGYSNDAYTLVAIIVEIVAGQPYEAFVREQLLEPAEMIRTGFWGPQIHPEVAAILGDRLPDTANTRPNWGFRGGTGMFSTCEDLHRWYEALRHGRVLSPPHVERLLSPHVRRGAIGVGYGWFVSTRLGNARSVWTRGYESFGHGVVLATYPETGTVLVVATNSGERTSGAPVSHQLADDLAQLILTPR